MSAAVRPHAVIRTMQPVDLRAIVGVERAAYEFPWSLGIFRDCLLAGYYCLVLDIDRGVQGYTIMSMAAGEAHVLNLCVHPDWQNLGYGRRLLDALVTKARDAAIHRVFLEVRPSNSAALSLYHSFGFEEVGVRPGYYQSREGREDAAVLVATLNDSAADP